MARGSNAHYLLVKALEKAGVKYEDITPVYLAPADAREHATYVIDNAGDRDALRANANRVYDQLLALR